MELPRSKLFRERAEGFRRLAGSSGDLRKAGYVNLADAYQSLADHVEVAEALEKRATRLAQQDAASTNVIAPADRIED